jgi:hypothetical protein
VTLTSTAEVGLSRLAKLALSALCRADSSIVSEFNLALRLVWERTSRVQRDDMVSDLDIVHASTDRFDDTSTWRSRDQRQQRVGGQNELVRITFMAKNGWESALWIGAGQGERVAGMGRNEAG